MKKKLFVCLAFINAMFVFGQEPCAYDKQQQRLFSENPLAKQAYLEAEYQLLNTDIQKFLQKKEISKNKSTNSTIYEIPIVVHLMNDGTTPLRTDAEIITWIDNCNKFYDTTFGGDWLTTAQGGTVIPFRLVLAKRSPSCTTTNGIVQVNVTATYPQYSTNGCNSDKTDGVSNVQLRALSRWDPQVYYNAYIVNTFDSTPITTTSGLQGYASFPTNPDDSYDTFMKASVVIDTNDPTTLPHEFGHSMGLHHPFNTGSTTACPTTTTPTLPTLPCNVDNDLVCDTPSTKSLLGVSPLPSNGSTNDCDTAGWNNVQYNVMNYTSSNRLFTAGQKDRAVTLFLQNRENLTKSLGGTALSGAPASVVTTNCIPPTAPTNTGNYQFGPTKVAIGTINNVSKGSSSANANQVLYNYTANSCLTTAFKTNLAVSANPQTLTVRCQTNPNNFSAWIDYNNNGTFEPSELIVNNQTVQKDTDTPFIFSIPSTGVTLNTPLRMRVIGDENDMSAAPCGQLAYGQVEDYEVTITATLLNETFDMASIEIYPNPVQDNLTVSLKNNEEIISYQIFDLMGKNVMSNEKMENNTVQVSALTNGVYFIKIKTITGEMVSKILKE